MSAQSPSPKRKTLCSRTHADRIALQLCESTDENVAVVRTGDEIQPYRVVPITQADKRLTELEVRVS